MYYSNNSVRFLYNKTYAKGKGRNVSMPICQKRAQYIPRLI